MKIKPVSHTVVRCPTKDDYIKLMKLLHASGFTWHTGKPLVDDTGIPCFWDGPKYCVNININLLGHGQEAYYAENKFNFITVSELETMFSCPDCKGTGVYVGFSFIEPCKKCGGKK